MSRRVKRTAEVSRVRVHAIEVRRSLDDFQLLRREDRQPVTKHLLHIRRVTAEVNRVLSNTQSQLLVRSWLVLSGRAGTHGCGVGMRIERHTANQPIK